MSGQCRSSCAQCTTYWTPSPQEFLVLGEPGNATAEAALRKRTAAALGLEPEDVTDDAVSVRAGARARSVADNKRFRAGWRRAAYLRHDAVARGVGRGPVPARAQSARRGAR